MNSEERFSLRLTRGKRTYFFDIKKSVAGSLYIKISESKKSKKGFDRFSVVVFTEDLDQFADTFQKVLTKFYECKGAETMYNKGTDTGSDHSPGKSYMPWTHDDDNKLESLYCEGLTFNQLAQTFERSLGAITSRIKKLQLEDKYGTSVVFHS